MSETPSNAWVRLEGSALRGAKDGPEPLKMRAFGTARGRLAGRSGKLAGMLDVDGHHYPYRDARSREGRLKTPIARFGEKDFIFVFRPVDGPEPPTLEVIGLRKALEDPGLVELVGVVVEVRPDSAVIEARGPSGAPVARTAVVGQLAQPEGQLVQAFARLTAGKLVLERVKALAIEPAPGPAVEPPSASATELDPAPVADQTPAPGAE